MLGKFFDTIWPLKELLSYIFKKSLGDYITNDLDLNSIEVEIKNKAFISLNNLELNAQEINNKHLKNSPIKMLDGRINRLDLYVSSEKIEFKAEEIFILLMPVFNLEKIKTNKLLKKQAVNIKTDTQVENSIISNLLNSALSKLEISVKNVCIKILSYEVCNIAQDNPTFSIYLSKIEYKNTKANNLNNYNHRHNQQTQDKLFFLNKQIAFDKICVKVRKNINNDEINFFNLSNLNDEKLFFNFFCDNSTIIAMKYSGFQNEFNQELNYSNISDCSILINFFQNEKDSEGIVIDLALKRMEIMLNPLQLSFILNFLEICGIIFKKQNDEKDSQMKNSSKSLNKNLENNLRNFESTISYCNQESMPTYDFIPPDQKPIKIFNSKLTNFSINLNLEMFNAILIENTYAYEIPKLWSFYEHNYSKQIKTVDNLESHFSYLEDNFFLFNLNNFDIKSEFKKTTSKDKVDLTIESLNLKFIEYKNKIKREKQEKKLKFTNSKLLTANNARHLSQVVGQSLINLSNINNPSINNNYNAMMNMSINASRASHRVNDQSLHQTIYQSFESEGMLIRNNSKESNNNSFSNTIFESAMESELILVNKYSKLLEYDYFYNSNNILTLMPQYQSDKTCFKLKLLKTTSYIDKRKEIIEKKSVNFMLGDLLVEFHPVFLFKATRLIYNHLVLVNEIFYYFSNLNLEKIDFNLKQDSDIKVGNKETKNSNMSTTNFEIKVKQENSESILNNLNNNKIPLDVSSTDKIRLKIENSLNNKTNSPSIKSNNSSIKLTRRVITQFAIAFNEIKINISSFSNDAVNEKDNKSANILNSNYFLNYYKNSIDDVLQLRNSNVPGYKINIKRDPLIESIKSKDKIQIKFSKSSCLIDLEGILSHKNFKTNKRNKGEILIKLGQILIYLNDNLMLNYTRENEAMILYDSSNNQSIPNNSNDSFIRNESYLAQSSQFSYTHVINKNPNKKFITGNYVEHKSIEDGVDEMDIETIFNRNKMKFRNSDISINLFNKNNIDLNFENISDNNFVENSNVKSVKSLSSNKILKSDLNYPNQSLKSSQRLNINKHITEFVKIVHKEYINHLPQQENLEDVIKKCILVNMKDEIEDDNVIDDTIKSNLNETKRKFSRAQISLNLNELNFSTDMKAIHILSKYLDNLTFAFNLHKILNKSIEDLYIGLKEKLFKSYNIRSINYLNRYKQDYTNDVRLNILNLSINKVIISLDKFVPKNFHENENILILKSSQKFNQFSQSQNLIKIILNKINLSQVGINKNNEIFCKLNNLSIYLAKLKYLKNENFKINKNVSEIQNMENYSTIIYSGESNQYNNITNNFLEFKLDFKEKSNQQQKKTSSLLNFLKEDKNFDLNFLTFEDFLNKNLIKLNDLQMNISLTVNNVIISPIFKDYDVDIMKELSDQLELIKKPEIHQKPFIQLIDKRKVDLFLDIKLNKFIVDLFYREFIQNYDDYLTSSNPKNWIRLILSFEKISYIKDNTISTAKFENFAINLLQDLRVEGADSLLTGKINKIGKEDSELKKFGFVEIVNSNLIKLNITDREESIQRPERKKSSGCNSNTLRFPTKKETKIDIYIDAFDFKFCKDSFEGFRIFIQKINEVSSKTIKALKNKKNKENPNFIIDENYSEINKSIWSESISVNAENVNNLRKERDNFTFNNTDRENEKKITNKFEKTKKTDPQFKLEILEDYCEGEFSNDVEDSIESINQDIQPKTESENKYDLEYYRGLSAKTAEELSQARNGNRNSSARRRSSFEIIKDPDSLEDSEENILQSHKEITINLTLSNFRIYLFDGKDFDFHYSENLENNHNSYIKNKNFQLNTNSSWSSSSRFEIIEDYCSTLPTDNKSTVAKTNIEERKRISHRDYDNQLGVYIQNFQFDFAFLNSITYSENIFKSSRFNIKIYKFDIDDYVKLSKYKKLLSKYEYDNKQCLIEIDIETKSHTNNQYSNQKDKMIKNVSDCDVELEEIEVFIDLKILPINILLDQATIIFLLEFFDVKLNKPEKKKNLLRDKDKKNKADDSEDRDSQNQIKISNDQIRPNSFKRKESIKLIFVRKVKLEEFFINFSYNSHSISISKIKNSNYLELLNISNISDFRIFLKDFEFVGCLTVNDTIDMIVNYWKEDITKNQIISAILTSVSLIRPFTTIMKGFFDIFKQPWIYYKTEKSLKDGFSKGIKNFIFSFASQSLFLGEKIFVTLKNYLGSHDTINQGNNLGKNSYYKKFVYYLNDSKKKYDEYYLKK